MAIKNSFRNHRTPKVTDRFINIYKPQADEYTLPTVRTADGNISYIQGITYPDWRTNDHTFIRDDSGRWHCFGITRPWVPGDNGHSGEGLCFHAVAPEGTFAQAVKFQSWKDLPKISVGDCGWAPASVKIGKEYSLIGSHLGRASSQDLLTWTDRGLMNIKGGGDRDPYIMFWEGTYYFLRCAGNGINLVTSKDFTNCSEPLVAEFTVHAPEIIQDENGQWFMSSADYPHRGVSVAPLEFITE
jgi:beta-fructofuranosidase